ncbi:MAG: Rieske (2Fe-2S) protein [Actinomycetota bacterium]
MKLFKDRAIPTGLFHGTKSSAEQLVAPTAEVPNRTVVGAGRYAVGNNDGEYFAVTRSCRHLLGDLAKGTIDSKGCLVCPVHGARYDVQTGRMVRGPQGIYAKIPGLAKTFQALTRIVPLGRAKVIERDGTLYVGDKI